MTLNGWAQIALFCVLVLALVRPLGGHLARLFEGERVLLTPVLGPVERGLYRLAGVNGRAEQHWVTYGAAMLLFNALGLVLLYGLQRLQHVLPLNPQNLPAV
jgi:K+-transporting ATPase ATPase A chain